ncbi:MAG: hypothetical protein ACO1SX_03860 [Actinomycetota bacterium]
MRPAKPTGLAHQNLEGLLTFTEGVVVLIGALLVALFLLTDATTLANIAPDPTIGRVRGAFTLVELWLGFHSPAPLIRVGEIVLAVAILATGFVRIRQRFAQEGAG